MRLSTILELLLIALLIAFAAYGRVIGPEGHGRAIDKKATAAIRGPTSASLKQTAETVNKYCHCNENICNCCRDFHIPLVSLSGPGCASLQYLQEDKLAMQLSIGDNILSSNVVSGKNPKPVCVALPGGFSKFCGKIYSIKREADKHFKACLGLELRSASELEASLRVSCFRFGPDGLKLRPAEPIPAITEPSTSSDDDYDDIFDLGDDEDEDEDDDEDDDQKTSPQDNAVATGEQDPEQEEEDDDDEDFGLGIDELLGLFTGADESSADKKKPSSTTLLPSSYVIPNAFLTSPQPPVASSGVASANKKPANPAASTASAPAVTSSQPSAAGSEVQLGTDADAEKEAAGSVTTDYPLDYSTAKFDEDKNADETTTLASDILGITEQNSYTEESHKNAPGQKIGTKLADKLKIKKPSLLHKKKVTVTSQSVNAIKNDALKPQQQHHHQSATDDDEDDYYNDSEADEDNEEADDSDEESTVNEEGEKDENEKNDVESEKHEDEEEEDDDDDDDDDEEEEEEEEEDAVLTALVDGEDGKDSIEAIKDDKKADKVPVKATNSQEDADYSYEIAELLARKQHPGRSLGQETSQPRRSRSRQSKVMRL